MALRMKDITPKHLRHSQQRYALYRNREIVFTLTRVYDTTTDYEPWILAHVIDNDPDQVVVVGVVDSSDYFAPDAWEITCASAGMGR